ncbi:glycosyltransferase family 2 protein [Leptothermofonsia sichuanensis E412]|nr:glycosyltransferase family 2 protein [Leptothermofonsia sichuanensis E412]
MRIVHPTQPVIASVIVPLYNAEKFVADALISILCERDIPLEVIVVNDRCTDASLEKVVQLGDPRIRVIDNSGKGIAAAMNTGLEVARGDIIMRCDADDLYPHQRLKDQVRWLLDNPEFGAICGNYSAIDSKGLLVVQFNCGTYAEEITAELQNGVTRTHFCTFAVRAEVLRQLGGFRDYFSTGEDIDLQLRLGESNRVWYDPSIRYQYRLHAASITHTISSIEREFFDDIARIYQQQRRLEGKDDIQRGCPAVPPSSRTAQPYTAAEHIQNLLIGTACEKYANGDKLDAIMTGLRSAMIQPSNLAVWRCLLALALKSS